MKFKFFIDKDRPEEVIVYAKEKTRLVEAIEQLVEDDSAQLTGYKESEVKSLKLSEIYCFTVEGNRLFALTKTEKWRLKSRLYQIEEKMSDSFIKINKSCIVSISKIENFDAAISGALMVVLKNGYRDYVSRRNVKNLKERLGI